MRDITEAGVREITRRINTGEISASETAAAFVEKAAAHSELNAFVRLVNKPATPVDGGNLFGVPIAHKDIFCERGVLSTCASRILENFVSPYDAAVVEKTRAAGMVSIGRTNMDEFAMGSSGEHSSYGPAKNPWDLSRVPGGSSSGSAAARWRLVFVRWRQERTPAVLFVSRLLFVVSLESNPPMGAFHAGE